MKKMIVSALILTLIMISIFFIHKNITPTIIHKNITPTITKEYLNATRMSTNPPRMPKRELFLFVGIVSAPSRLDRRNAIRETWIKGCQSNPDAVCRFFTDGQDPKGQVLQGEKKIRLENESRVYGDILLVDAPGGINFAIKYLWMLQWVNERYDVRYFLRLDDDYFVCFRKLMAELKLRPKEKFIWGWLHCSHKGISENPAIVFTRLSAAPNKRRPQIRPTLVHNNEAIN